MSSSRTAVTDRIDLTQVKFSVKNTFIDVNINEIQDDEVRMYQAERRRAVRSCPSPVMLECYKGFEASDVAGPSCLQVVDRREEVFDESAISELKGPGRCTETSAQYTVSDKERDLLSQLLSSFDDSDEESPTDAGALQQEALLWRLLQADSVQTQRHEAEAPEQNVEDMCGVDEKPRTGLPLMTIYVKRSSFSCADLDCMLDAPTPLMGGGWCSFDEAATPSVATDRRYRR